MLVVCIAEVGQFSDHHRMRLLWARPATACRQRLVHSNRFSGWSPSRLTASGSLLDDLIDLSRLISMANRVEGASGLVVWCVVCTRQTIHSGYVLLLLELFHLLFLRYCWLALELIDLCPPACSRMIAIQLELLTNFAILKFNDHHLRNKIALNRTFKLNKKNYFAR